MTAPGWYPDPHVPGQMRWWDGTTWTAHVGPAAGAPAGPGVPLAPTAPAAPAASGPNRTGLIVGIGGGLVLVVVIIIGGLTVLGGTAQDAGPTTTVPTSTVTHPTTHTPTSESVGGVSLSERADQAGVPLLDTEGAATHTHSLLHITVDGEEVVIPAGVGIDERKGRIAALHTHEDRGVLHVESPTEGDTYTLGQFLTLWGMGSTTDELCASLATSGCTVDVAVVAPTKADQREFESFGPMPDEPPVAADGLDTELAQGVVIEMTITTAS